MRRFWCQAFIAVASARDRRSISRQTSHAEKASGFQGTKWPIPRISLLAKCPSNEEDSSLGGYLTKERGVGNEKWDHTL